MSESESVFICYEWEPSEATNGHDGEWIAAGVVTNEHYAEMWMEPTPDNKEGIDKGRRYREFPLNVVEAFYTEHME